MSKSPNAKTSMKNLDMAIRLILNAKEDLKNDSEVRDIGAHNMLDGAAQDIDHIKSLLQRIGY